MSRNGHKRSVGALLAVVVLAVTEATAGFALAAPDLEVEPFCVGFDLEEPIRPLPRKVILDAGQVALGRRLFHDTKLSGDGSVACATCHPLSIGGMDRSARSTGIGGARGDINAPTVFNSGFNSRQFWDGRAHSLEEQVDGPTQHPKEMGSTWPGILDALRADADYVRLFQESYGSDVQAEHVRHAIATFERSLVTPASPLDRYLCGDPDALSTEARAGYELFKSLGCASCHQGTNAGGNLFQKLGVMHEYFPERRPPIKADLGRFNITGAESDRFTFRVPSLRNVARTAPYFHDGSAPTLDAAVRVMAFYQLGRVLTPEDVRRLVSFLEALTGEYEGRPL